MARLPLLMGLFLALAMSALISILSLLAKVSATSPSAKGSKSAPVAFGRPRRSSVTAASYRRKRRARGH